MVYPPQCREVLNGVSSGPLDPSILNIQSSFRGHEAQVADFLGVLAWLSEFPESRLATKLLETKKALKKL